MRQCDGAGSRVRGTAVRASVLLLLLVPLALSAQSRSSSSRFRQAVEYRRQSHVHAPDLWLRSPQFRLRRRGVVARLSRGRQEPERDHRLHHPHPRPSRWHERARSRRPGDLPEPGALRVGARLLDDSAERGEAAARVSAQGRVHHLRRLRRPGSLEQHGGADAPGAARVSVPPASTSVTRSFIPSTTSSRSKCRIRAWTSCPDTSRCSRTTIRRAA